VSLYRTALITVNKRCAWVLCETAQYLCLACVPSLVENRQLLISPRNCSRSLRSVMHASRF